MTVTGYLEHVLPEVHREREIHTVLRNPILAILQAGEPDSHPLPLRPELAKARHVVQAEAIQAAIQPPEAFTALLYHPFVGVIRLLGLEALRSDYPIAVNSFVHTFFC